jgi:putative tryptophan/tyrosine transport system substrate-binding protein
MTFDQLKRREFIRLAGGAAIAWPFAARSQPSTMPIVALVNPGTAEATTRYATAFRNALSDAGFVDGQNVTIEYHWLAGQYDRLPALMADIVRRRVAVIATPGGTSAALAVKAAASTIPIVFGVGEDPVKMGLVANLSRPGGNATGINFFLSEIVAKRLGLLHDIVPKATRVAVLVNPASPLVADSTLRDVREAAATFGLQLQILKAQTIAEIDAVFAAMAQDRVDALFIAPDAFFTSRRGQFATLAARDRIPTSSSNREMVEAGLLMSYGTNIADMFRQVGTYTAQILKGAKPADLPVLQSTKFEFVINMQTAKALGMDVPHAIQLLADEIIE